MVEISFNGWLIDSDNEANRRFDRAAAGFGVQSCDCIYCRNFFAIKEEVYSDEVLEFIEKLCVRRPFEVEVVEYGRLNGGILYHAWIPFFGAIKSRPEPTDEIILFEGFNLNV